MSTESPEDGRKYPCTLALNDLPGRFAFLANGPRACERRNGVDEVGVVL